MDMVSVAAELIADSSPIYGKASTLSGWVKSYEVRVPAAGRDGYAA
jgi:hypothetical protein